MTIYPAIDIRKGRAVRLIQGKAEQSTDYGDPVEAARRWAEDGAQALHMVDLDGAFDGVGLNLAVVSRVVQAVKVPVQLGGGIRTLDDIRERLELVGVARVILGTAATVDPKMVEEACRRYPGRIVLGLDVRDGRVAVRGWAQESELTPAQVLPRMRDAGIDTVIFTDISRDGMLSGPNVELTAQVVEQSGMRVIGSGGVGSLSDIAALRAAGCAGVILGKSLYSGAISLGDALRCAQGGEGI